MKIIRRIMNYGIAIALLGVLVFSVMTMTFEGFASSQADVDKINKRKERKKKRILVYLRKCKKALMKVKKRKEKKN